MNTVTAFDKMNHAAKTVFDRVAKSANRETDPDLMVYDSLKSEDFDGILKEYGVENTLSYVRSMEFKRLTKRK